jgi:PAS domain S-box-containing protein
MPPIRILVVEDENIVAKDIENRLVNLGYQVTGVAATGQGAIDQAATAAPDLILMDIKLRGPLDGVETADRLRRQHQVPIVYLTAYADQTTLERAKITEPFGYILKPFEERDLQITIEMALYKHRMEQQLKESQQWFVTTLTCIGDAVLATGLDGAVRFINPAAAALTGWPQAQAIGRPLDEVFATLDETSGAVRLFPFAAIINGRSMAASWPNALLACRDGRRRSIEAQAAPIQDGQGRIIGAVLSFRDITERQATEEQIRRMNEELVRANEELRTLDRTKTNLLSNVSHELRTPLVAVRGYTEMIATGLSGPVNETQSYQLKIALRSIDRLVTLIDSLLDFSRLELGREKLRSTTNNLCEIAREALALIRPKAQGAGVLVREEIPGAALWFQGDRDKIAQVFLNILDNAVKFNHAGGTVTLTVTTPTPDAVQVSISDTGIGIPADQLGRIFDRFYQVDASSTRTFGGMGIGLAICRDIISLHQGTIQATGQPGTGATFTFRLPRAALDTVPALTAAPSHGSPDEHRRPQTEYKVLIMNDTPEAVRTIELMLNSRRFRPVLVRKAAELLPVLGHEAIDLVLIEGKLAHADSLSLCRSVKQHPQHGRLPVVLMLDHPTPAQKHAARQAGVAVVIGPPSPKKEWFAALTAALKKSPKKAGR